MYTARIWGLNSPIWNFRKLKFYTTHFLLELFHIYDEVQFLLTDRIFVNARFLSTIIHNVFEKSQRRYKNIYIYMYIACAVKKFIYLFYHDIY